jgi:hypothetical protein
MKIKPKQSEVSRYLVLKDYRLYLTLQIDNTNKEIARLEKKMPELVKKNEKEAPIAKIYRIKPIKEGHLYIEFEGCKKKSGILHYNTMDYQFTKTNQSLSRFMQAFTDIESMNICWHISSNRAKRLFKIPVEELIKMVI